MLTPLCRILTQVANQVLQQDSALQESLRPYVGHAVAIDVLGIDAVVYLHIADDQVSIDTRQPEGAFLTTVRAAPSVWLRILQDYSRGSAVRMQGLRIDGDAALISQLLLLAKSMPIDWESYLATQWGDTPAMLGVRALQGLHSGLSFARRATRENIRDAIHDEWELAPSPWAFSDFSEQVAALRDDVDRLAARVDYLKKRSASCEE